jgi:flagellar hook-length control protein FliK
VAINSTPPAAGAAALKAAAANNGPAKVAAHSPGTSGWPPQNLPGHAPPTPAQSPRMPLTLNTAAPAAAPQAAAIHDADIATEPLPGQAPPTAPGGAPPSRPRAKSAAPAPRAGGTTDTATATLLAAAVPVSQQPAAADEATAPNLEAAPELDAEHGRPASLAPTLNLPTISATAAPTPPSLSAAAPAATAPAPATVNADPAPTPTLVTAVAAMTRALPPATAAAADSGAGQTASNETSASNTAAAAVGGVFADATAARAGGTSPAPVVPELSVQTPVGAPGWAEDVGAHVIWLAHQGVTDASLRLQPEHLGPVEVKISLRESAASVWFGSAQPATRAALELALPQLKELFAAQGMTLTDSGVSRESARDSQYSPRSATASTAASASAESADSVSISLSRRGLIDTYA